MKVLVTGGCGFIGANLVRRLVSSGHAVRVIDDFSTGCRAYVADEVVEIIEADVRDEHAITKSAKGMDAIVHLAARGSVVKSIEDPVLNFETNVQGTLSVLRACVGAEVQRFVFASTGGALMGNMPPPVDESTLPWPISPYGASKVCGEAYCHAFAGSYGVNPIILRFANVYGPWSGHKHGAVTRFISQALNGDPHVIYGDGSATRDYLFVEDICQGIEAGLTTAEFDSVFHLATGVETTIESLSLRIRTLAGTPDLPVVFLGPRLGEVERTYATAAKAREVLQWEPLVDLSAGLADTVAWFANHPRGFAA